MTSIKYGQLFQLSYTKPLSPTAASSAVVLPGSKLNFWVAGTSYSTAQSVYADSSLQNVLSQPITADSNGRFVPVYLNPALQYAYTLNSSGNVLLQQAPYINVPNPSQPVQLVVDAQESRASTTTLAIDPTLQYFLPNAGTYKVELLLDLFANAAGATPGISLSVEFSGTLNPNAGNTLAISGFLNGNSLTVGQSSAYVNGVVSGSLGTSTLTNVLSITGTIQVSTSGTLALYWAQQNSSANATFIYQGSSMSVTQIA